MLLHHGFSLTGGCLVVNGHDAFRLFMRCSTGIDVFDKIQIRIWHTVSRKRLFISADRAPAEEPVAIPNEMSRKHHPLGFTFRTGFDRKFVGLNSADFIHKNLHPFKGVKMCCTQQHLNIFYHILHKNANKKAVQTWTAGGYSLGTRIGIFLITASGSSLEFTGIASLSGSIEQLVKIFLRIIKVAPEMSSPLYSQSTVQKNCSARSFRHVRG